MDNISRIALLRARLEQALSPNQLDIIDESHLHKGHAGAQSGAGHFALTIQAQQLSHISRIEAHRLIYQAVGNLIPDEIHALRIQIVPTGSA